MKKISLTSGADNYASETANKIIYALGGNDTVENYADKVTIFGGAGKDFIVNHDETKIKIDGGNGNDTIFGFDSNDTLYITKGSYQQVCTKKVPADKTGIYYKEKIFSMKQKVTFSLSCHKLLRGVFLQQNHSKPTSEQFCKSSGLLKNASVQFFPAKELNEFFKF